MNEGAGGADVPQALFYTYQSILTSNIGFVILLIY